jgi:hypothetical protein
MSVAMRTPPFMWKDKSSTLSKVASFGMDRRKFSMPTHTEAIFLHILKSSRSY